MQHLLTSRSYRRYVAAVVLGLLAVWLTTGQSAHSQKRATNPTVEIVIENRGKITVELLSTEAPKTARHFLDLASRKFYDGILFHRVVPGFVAQAGDPASKKVSGAKIAQMTPEDAARVYGLGGGGSGKTVPLEADVPQTRGTVGLARSQAPDSGDSQFYFNLVDNHGLDNQYCVFGKVTKGLDVMDSIRQGDKIKSIRIVAKSRSKK